MPETIEPCQNLQRGLISTAAWLSAKALAAGATSLAPVKRSWGTVNTLVKCRTWVASIETLCATPDMRASELQPFFKGVNCCSRCIGNVAV